MKKSVYIYSFSLVVAIFLWLYLSLNANFNVTLEIPLEIKIGNTQAITGNVPDSMKVTLNGRGWDLVSILLAKDLVYSVDLSGIQRDVRLSTFQQINERLGIPYSVRVLNVEPDTVYVAFGQVVQKKVPVRSNITVQTRDGYNIVGSPVLYPDSVIVTGSAKDVADVKFISTEEKTFRNVSENLVTEVKLVADEKGKIKIEPQDIKIEYKIELSAEKVFDEIEVVIRNVPEDKEVLLIPPNVRISIRGGVNELSNINPSEITVHLGYETIEQDTLGYVIPRVEIPGNPDILEIFPDKFQYIIKNK